MSLARRMARAQERREHYEATFRLKKDQTQAGKITRKGARRDLMEEFDLNNTGRAFRRLTRWLKQEGKL